MSESKTVENVKLASLQTWDILPVRGEFVNLDHARLVRSEDDETFEPGSDIPDLRERK